MFTDKNNGNKLYALRAEIQSPDKLRVPAEDNSANGRSIGAEDTTAQNAEDVNSENQTTATFSIRAANPSTLDRFTTAPLGERIIHTIRTERSRKASILILAQATHASHKSPLRELRQGEKGQFCKCSPSRHRKARPCIKLRAGGVL